MKKLRPLDAILIVTSVFAVAMIWLTVRDFLADRDSAQQKPLLGAVYPTRAEF